MRTFSVCLLFTAAVCAQDLSNLRIIGIGAHPDDCDIKFGGTAAKFAMRGAKVKCLAVTNGDAGHQTEGGGALARRRRAEAKEAGRRIGIEYDVLDNHDGELLPTVEIRQQIIRKIRQWNANMVLSPRPNDYHPDHRYTGVLVQDAAYMVVVPNVTPDTPPLRDNPVFFYFSDRFQRPQPFRADVVISIDDVVSKKIDMLDAHTSQVYEWLPWVDHELDQVPKDPQARKAWLAKQRFFAVDPAWKPSLVKWYGPKADSIKQVEAFEICEYGRRPSDEELRKMFPF